jgi:hypothetical protein
MHISVTVPEVSDVICVYIYMCLYIYSIYLFFAPLSLYLTSVHIHINAYIHKYIYTYIQGHGENIDITFPMPDSMVAAPVLSTSGDDSTAVFGSTTKLCRFVCMYVDMHIYVYMVCVYMCVIHVYVYLGVVAAPVLSTSGDDSVTVFDSTTKLCRFVCVYVCM